MARNVKGPDRLMLHQVLGEQMPAACSRMCAEVPYYYAPTAPMAAPAVMTMPMRQCLPRARAEISRSRLVGDVAVLASEGCARIYVVPRTVVPPTPAPYTAHLAGFELMLLAGMEASAAGKDSVFRQGASAFVDGRVVREKAMDAHGQAKADVYALSMGRGVAGKASSRFYWTIFDGLAVLRHVSCPDGRCWGVRPQQSCVPITCRWIEEFASAGG
ncbi:unnamed protein product [Symbiodinium sp. CCMP2592]|nr:unnamed protein product [Symbiodinium sp. CCMP2592]